MFRKLLLSVAFIGLATSAFAQNLGGGLTSSSGGGSSGVSSFSAGTTGLTPSTGTTGAVTLGGTLAVANGGTGTTTAFTAGSAVFAGASGVYSQDNANFFWDATNHRLGIGTATPATSLAVNGVSTFLGSTILPVRTVTASGAITVSATTDYDILVNKTTGAATTVNLPASPATGLSYIIKDQKCDDATNNITLTPNSGNIEGGSTYVMNTSSAGNCDRVGIIYAGGSVGWAVQ